MGDIGSHVNITSDWREHQATRLSFLLSPCRATAEHPCSHMLDIALSNLSYAVLAADELRTFREATRPKSSTSVGARSHEEMSTDVRSCALRARRPVPA